VFEQETSAINLPICFFLYDWQSRNVLQFYVSLIFFKLSTGLKLKLCMLLFPGQDTVFTQPVS